MPSKSMENLRDMDSHIWNASMWWSRLQELHQKWIRQSEAVRSGCQDMLEHSVSTSAQHAEFCAEVSEHQSMQGFEGVRTMFISWKRPNSLAPATYYFPLRGRIVTVCRMFSRIVSIQQIGTTEEVVMQVVMVEVGKCRLANTCTVQHGCRQQRKLSHELEESARHAREQSKLQHCREARLLRHENNKSMVREYTQYRRKLAQQQVRCQSEVIEMAKHHKLPAQLRNSERVKYRQQALVRKHDETLQHEEMLAEEQRQREQRMDRLRALVSASA